MMANDPHLEGSSDYESEGRRFESCRAYQLFSIIIRLFLVFVF